jgi:hypothetical protein
VITVEVRPDGGDPYKLTATSRDVAFWEKTHRGKKMADLNEPAVLDLYAIAHIAARRQGMFSGTAEEFIETNDITQEDDGEPDPTRTAP